MKYIARPRILHLALPTSVSLRELLSAGSTAFLSLLRTIFARSLGAPQLGVFSTAHNFHVSTPLTLSAPHSSRILSNFKPCFNATVVQRLLDAGAVPIAKTVMDEFGMGSFTLNRKGSSTSSPSSPCSQFSIQSFVRSNLHQSS